MNAERTRMGPGTRGNRCLSKVNSVTSLRICDPAICDEFSLFRSGQLAISLRLAALVAVGTMNLGQVEAILRGERGGDRSRPSGRWLRFVGVGLGVGFVSHRLGLRRW